jgi:hypothetical protein
MESTSIVASILLNTNVLMLASFSLYFVLWKPHTSNITSPKSGGLGILKVIAGRLT